MNSARQSHRWEFKSFRAVVLICLALVVALIAASGGTLLSQAANRAHQQLTFEDRVAAQRSIEAVYWRHRLWPKENPQPKPSLDQVMPEAAIRAKVEDYLRKSQALEVYWQRPITAEQLQAEMDRMARQTKQPEVLRELWAALGNDPMMIAECLARPALVERLTRDLYASDERQQGGLNRQAKVALTLADAVAVSDEYRLPEIEAAPDQCFSDAWKVMSTTGAPSGRYNHTAVWTGSEMIIWGGDASANASIYLITGGRYNPATDSWTATTETGAPIRRGSHTAVWTGSEMIVWGGYNFDERTISAGGTTQ